jgi:hypothetical protein
MPNINASDYLESSMNDSLNPFDIINENPKYPLARLYRRSVLTGIADTYEILVGNHYRDTRSEETHCGFLDMLIFPLLSQWLMRIAFPDLTLIKEAPKEWKKTEVLGKTAKGTSVHTYNEIPGTMPLPIRILAGTFAFLLEVPRGFLGIALTLVLSPVVAVVHAALFFKANQLKNEVNQLQVVPDGEIEPLQLKEFLKQGHCDLNKITVDEEGNYIRDYIGKGECSFRFFENANGDQEKQGLEARDQLNIGGKKFR